MKRFSFVILLLFLLACSSENKKAEGIWSREEFTEAMVKVQITEAMLRLGYHRIQDSLILGDSLYAATYRQFGSNSEEFQRNLEYYAEDPVVMEKIYEEVITRLSQLEASRRGADTL